MSRIFTVEMMERTGACAPAVLAGDCELTEEGFDEWMEEFSGEIDDPADAGHPDSCVSFYITELFAVGNRRHYLPIKRLREEYNSRFYEEHGLYPEELRFTNEEDDSILRSHNLEFLVNVYDLIMQ